MNAEFTDVMLLASTEPSGLAFTRSKEGKLSVVFHHLKNYFLMRPGFNRGTEGVLLKAVCVLRSTPCLYRFSQPLVCSFLRQTGKILFLLIIC